MARRLGYEPDWRKRAQARLRFGSIAQVYTTDMGTSGIYEAVPYAASSWLRAHGFRFAPVAIGHDEASWRTALAEYRLDGAFAVGSIPAGFATWAARLGFPFAHVNPHDDAESFGIYPDDRAAGRIMGEHLRALGHRRALLLLRSEREEPDHCSLAKRRAGLAEVGIASEVVLASTEEVLSIAAQRKPTAALCQAHNLGLQLIRHLVGGGIAVPGEISVAAFTDHYSARWSLPSLTTIELPMEEMITAACACLVRMIDGGSSSTDPQVTPVRLIIRESTGLRR